MAGELSGAASGAAAGSAFGPWGTVIGAGIGLLGSMYASEGADERASRQDALSREFAQMGIRWRVADAKAAGLHPLFALSGAGATYNPSAISVGDGGFGQFGQSVGRAIEQAMTAEERQSTAALQREVIESSIELNRARSVEALSNAARTNQTDTPSFPMPAASRPGIAYSQFGSVPAPFAGYDEGFPTIEGPSRREAMGMAAARAQAGPHDFGFDSAKVGTSREFDPTMAAGPPRPMFEEYRVGTRPYDAREGEFGRDRGLYLALPSGGNASEALEAIAEGGGRSPVAALIYAENIRRYGADYVHALRDYLRGGAAQPSLSSQLSSYGRSFLDEWRRRRAANRGPLERR